MATPLEKELLKIHTKVTINDEDRKPYTEMFDVIKNWLINEMREIDPVFNKLCKGTSLFGSFSNQVRIIKPSEFDIFILLQFPFPMTITLLEGNPGFVRLELVKTLKLLNNDLNYRDVYNKFIGFTDQIKGHTCLNRKHLQGWITNIINDVLETRPLPKGYSISFGKRNVAQNMYVTELSNPHKKISIDFVPGIKIGGDDKVERRPFIKFKDLSTNNFIVVPKSIPGKAKYRRISGEHSFQVVNPTAEHDILWDKNNLKVVYRLLKSVRDHYDLNRMKSYFLTTIFLWEIQKHNDDFWRKPVDYLFIHMLQKLAEYFARRKLPYFWIEGFNLLNILVAKEITRYAADLKYVSNTFKSYQNLNNLSYNEVVSHFKIRSE